jgi:anti-anti-sigma factor
MIIDIKRRQNKITLKVCGRLDTTTAPQLEKELADEMKGRKEVILDFTELEYISSAGLRVLLSTHKTMKKQGGKMIVRNVNEEVREVFVITGFSEIMDLE